MNGRPNLGPVVQDQTRACVRPNDKGVDRSAGSLHSVRTALAPARPEGRTASEHHGLKQHLYVTEQRRPTRTVVRREHWDWESWRASPKVSGRGRTDPVLRGPEHPAEVLPGRLVPGTPVLRARAAAPAPRARRSSAAPPGQDHPARVTTRAATLPARPRAARASARADTPPAGRRPATAPRPPAEASVIVRRA